MFEDVWGGFRISGGDVPVKEIERVICNGALFSFCVAATVPVLKYFNLIHCSWLSAWSPLLLQGLIVVVVFINILAFILKSMDIVMDAMNES